MPHCSRCGYREAVAKARCRDCYRYWKKHGVERPLQLIQQQWERRGGRPLHRIVRDHEVRTGRRLAPAT